MTKLVQKDWNERKCYDCGKIQMGRENQSQLLQHERKLWLLKRRVESKNRERKSGVIDCRMKGNVMIVKKWLKVKTEKEKIRNEWLRNERK